MTQDNEDHEDHLKARIADLLRRWGNEVASRLGKSTSVHVGLTATEIAQTVLADGQEPTGEQVAQTSVVLKQLAEGKAATPVSRNGKSGTRWMHSSAVASLRQWYDLHLDPSRKTRHPRDRLIEWARIAPEQFVRETLRWAQHLYLGRRTSPELPEPCSFCGDPATVIWDCENRGEWSFVKMCLDCFEKVQSVVESVEQRTEVEMEEN